MAHCLRTLAGYLTPPQTYELCQTAKAFQVNENGVPRATRALRVSLERSLARVLKARGLSPEAVDFKALVDADGRPGALIAGSTMVQCGPNCMYLDLGADLMGKAMECHVLCINQIVASRRREVTL